MDVYSLRVRRDQVGAAFPFDRIYLVHYQDRGYVEKLFRHALVMPLEGELLAALKTQKLDVTVDRPFERDDEESTPNEQPKKNTLEKLLEKGDWILVVPILNRWMKEAAERIKKNAEQPQKEKGHAAPRYVMSPKWFGGRRGRHRIDQKLNIIPTHAYLQLDGKKVRPICVMCPRNILHQNGECHVGQAECVTHLSLGLKNHFKEGLEAPNAAPNMKEIEDGELQEVDA